MPPLAAFSAALACCLGLTAAASLPWAERTEPARTTSHMRRLQTTKASCTDDGDQNAVGQHCDFEAKLPKRAGAEGLAARGGAGYSLTSAEGKLSTHLYVSAADFDLMFDANMTLNGCELTDGLTLEVKAALHFPNALYAAASAYLAEIKGQDAATVTKMRNIAQDHVTVIADEYKGRADDKLEEAWLQVNSKFEALIDDTGKFFKNAVATVGAAFGKVGDTVKDGFKTIGDAFRGLGRRRTQSKSQLVKMLTKGFSVKDFTMPANPMVVTGSWSLTPDSNEATVDLNQVLATIPQAKGVAAVMGAAGVKVVLRLTEPAFTKDGVALKVFAKVTLLDSLASDMCRGQPKYCCVQRSLGEIGCKAASAADKVYGWVGGTSNLGDACSSSQACCVKPGSKCVFPVCSFTGADCSADTGSESKCANPACGILKQGVWLLTKALTGTPGFVLLNEEFNLISLVYDALPAAKRPPWLKPDKIEVGDTSACFAIFGLRTGSAAALGATSVVVASSAALICAAAFALLVLLSVCYMRKRGTDHKYKTGSFSTAYKHGWAQGNERLQTARAKVGGLGCWAYACWPCMKGGAKIKGSKVGACLGKLPCCRCCRKGPWKAVGQSDNAAGAKKKKKKKKPKPKPNSVHERKVPVITCTMLFAYTPDPSKTTHMATTKGQELEVLDSSDTAWTLVRKVGGRGEGAYVPRNHTSLSAP